MSQLHLSPIDRVDDLSKEQFQEYYRANKPVVFRTFAKGWPALDKWTYDYFKAQQGDIQVPIQEGDFATSGRSYLSESDTMRFADYLDLIANTPTQKRMFLFNIFKHMPELCDDFSYPDLGINFVKKMPFMFFGGEGSYVDMHFDVDLSHVFLTQFAGKKKIILYAPEYSTALCRHPLTVANNIDLGNPDFDRYPQLTSIPGIEANLEHGDSIFMPSGYWHYVHYTTGGFSLSLRALSSNYLRRMQGFYNIFKLVVLDRNITRLLGAKRWYNKKEQMALARAKRSQ